MAIKKTKTLNNGSVGEYWRILSIHIDRQSLTACARIALFKDKAASDAGLQPLGAVKEFRFSFTMSEFFAAPNAIAFAYQKIRSIAETMRTFDIHGEPLETPVPYDPDLAGGEVVI